MDIVIDTAKGIALLSAFAVGFLWLLTWVVALSNPSSEGPKGWFAVWLFAPLGVIVLVLAWQIGRAL